MDSPRKLAFLRVQRATWALTFTLEAVTLIASSAHAAVQTVSRNTVRVGATRRLSVAAWISTYTVKYSIQFNSVQFNSIQFNFINPKGNNML
jgi:hypothetical protein